MPNGKPSVSKPLRVMMDSCSDRSWGAAKIDVCRKILEPYRKCAGAVQPCEATILSRRGIGDKEIWTKPRAACGGRGGAMGFAWVFEDSWA